MHPKILTALKLNQKKIMKLKKKKNLNHLKQ